MKELDQVRRDIAAIGFIAQGGGPGDEDCAGILVYRGVRFAFILSWGDGWEHLSVSRRHRCPTWEEMCLFKDLFWRGDEAVMQLHPAQSEYVNVHPFCLHLWRPTDQPIPMPPKSMVG
jgi:hypothetical protein